MRSECARNKQYNSTKVGRLRPGVANELGYICVIGGMKVGNTCAGGEKESRTECRKTKPGELCVCTRTELSAPSREGGRSGLE